MDFNLIQRLMTLRRLEWLFEVT